MAGTKKEVNNETENTKNIDMDKLIQNAVAKALAESSKEYQNKINKLTKQLEEKSQQEECMTMKPDKMVLIQHIAPGRAAFHRGRVNVTFQKLFDKKRIKWDILDEMYNQFRDWFDDFEIIIEDKEVREYYGLEESFKQKGADEKVFKAMLDENDDDMLSKINLFSNMVSFAFLKFFVDEYTNANPKCMGSKFKAIENFYNNKYGINNLQELMQEMN